MWSTNAVADVLSHITCKRLYMHILVCSAGIYADTSMCAYIYIYIYVYIQMYTQMHMCVRNIYIYTHIKIHTFTCVCVCIYTYLHICTYTQQQGQAGNPKTQSGSSTRNNPSSHDVFSTGEHCCRQQEHRGPAFKPPPPATGYRAAARHGYIAL